MQQCIKCYGRLAGGTNDKAGSIKGKAAAKMGSIFQVYGEQAGGQILRVEDIQKELETKRLAAGKVRQGIVLSLRWLQ